jgi:sulfotransferase family protein
MLASSVVDTRLTLRVKSALVRTVRPNLLRLRHQRQLRLIPVVYRHATVSRQDAFLVSYPKSGNTWLKFMLTSLLSGNEADFDNDSSVIANVGSHRATPRLLPDGGRLIKSHEPYSNPQKHAYRKAIYLVRDGRDVAVSYYHTLIRRGKFEGDFGPFLRLFLGGGVDGYGPWHQHVESWLASPLRANGSLLVLKYEDLLTEPVQGVGQVMEFLGRPVSPEQAEETVRAYSVERMREQERQSRFHEKKKRRDIMFVRSAKSGGWVETFTPEDEAFFATVAGEVLGQLGYDSSR